MPYLDNIGKIGVYLFLVFSTTIVVGISSIMFLIVYSFTSIITINLIKYFW